MGSAFKILEKYILEILFTNGDFSKLTNGLHTLPHKTKYSRETCKGDKYLMEREI